MDLMKEKKRDYSFLTNLPGASSEKLEIYNADLDEPDSFAPAIKGCIGVFHLATTIDIENKEPEQVVIRRTIEGAFGILHLCLNSKTVKKVVYTSSVAALFFNGKNQTFLDENSWSDVDYMNMKGMSYPISKTLTEKAVFEFSEKYGLEVVTVIPSYVVGPFICPKLPASVRRALALILGNEEEFGLLSKLNMVHVDDLARAQIFVFENPNAKGRYICSSNKITLEELAKFLSTKYPEFQIPSQESLKDVKGFQFTDVSSKKLLDSGFVYKCGIDEMFDGAIQSCKEKGYL